MIARVLSGGPVFVPRKARSTLNRIFEHRSPEERSEAMWTVRVICSRPPTGALRPAFTAQIIPFPKGAA